MGGVRGLAQRTGPGSFTAQVTVAAKAVGGKKKKKQAKSDGGDVGEDAMVLWEIDRSVVPVTRSRSLDLGPAVLTGSHVIRAKVCGTSTVTAWSKELSFESYPSEAAMKRGVAEVREAEAVMARLVKVQERLNAQARREDALAQRVAALSEGLARGACGGCTSAFKVTVVEQSGESVTLEATMMPKGDSASAGDVRCVEWVRDATVITAVKASSGAPMGRITMHNLGAGTHKVQARAHVGEGGRVLESNNVEVSVARPGTGHSAGSSGALSTHAHVFDEAAEPCTLIDIGANLLDPMFQGMYNGSQKVL